MTCYDRSPRRRAGCVDTAPRMGSDQMVSYDSTMRALAAELSTWADPANLKGLTVRIRTVRSAAFSTARYYAIMREILTPLQITLLPADFQWQIRGGG